MTNKRLRPAKNKEDRQRLDSNDYISRMPDDVLLLILCFLPMKYAVVTDILSTRWRHVWRKLKQLNFDGSESLPQMLKPNCQIYFSEQAKYIDQVNNIIRSYDHPTVTDFRIRFDLNLHYFEEFGEWLQFAIDKKVEILELDMRKDSDKHIEPELGYPVTYCFSSYDRWCLPSREIFYLKGLYLKNVNMTDAALKDFLINSPNLEIVSIHGSIAFTFIDVGGQTLKLKHFEIVGCVGIDTINLFDFGLVSFIYTGPKIELKLTNLPSLKQLDIGGPSWLGNNVFRWMTSCFSYLQVLSFKMLRPKENLKLDSIPKLPNVKKLRLTIGAQKDESLLGFTNLAKACPSLETLTIELLWVCLRKSKRQVRHVASDEPHERLKLLEIVGYYGRTCDFELVMYFIENAVGLKRIVIDPRHQGRKGTAPHSRYSLKMVENVRSSVKSQFDTLMREGTDMIIL